jgi:hypothetical protein
LNAACAPPQVGGPAIVASTFRQQGHLQERLLMIRLEIQRFPVTIQ